MIGLLTWLLVPLFNAWMDRKGAKRNYLQVNILRGIAMLVHAVIFFDPQGGYHILKDLWASVPYLVYYFGSYFFVFTIILNILQGRIKQLGLVKGLNYYDKKEKDSGWTDRLFAKMGENFHFIILIISLISSVFSFLLLSESL